MPQASTLDTLRSDASRAMRAYIDAPGPGPERAIATKAAASALVDARELFYDRDGAPDLLGRSYEYRLFVKSALDEAGVPQSDRAGLQAAIRYQVSPILHERHGEELESRGLDSGSTRDRARRRRERESSILRVFGGGAPITNLDDATLAAHLARVAFTRIRPVEDASARDIEELAEAFTRAASAGRDAAKRVRAE
ncbi:hypothetical protein SEA_CEN1621_24 [Microbacterium phage Cen1621]|uniref:Uncharacterized protein n=1 Tax=Microbacterium phage Cen1621 TaxID=2965191 RepID=A0A9E7QDF5_9CAUD|nr:hypothetical protein SEA_CEN1621_24 [Microbacterium phage Cen1621]